MNFSFMTASAASNDQFQQIITSPLGITLSIILYILFIIPIWKMFEKAGEKGWKAIIPIYDIYILYKIGWSASMFWVYLLVNIIFAVPTAFAMGGLGVAVSIIFGIIAVIIDIIYAIKLSKSFGHSTLFAIGYFIFPLIFEYIMAFDSKEYSKIEK